MLCLLDLDAFFCACEEARRPELRGVPFCVGGSPDGRGVVATASYAARRFGVGSALPSAEARRRCPDLLFLRPDMAHYRSISRTVWTGLTALSPAVQQTGIDEGYLAVPEGRDAESFARRLQRAVGTIAGVTCSVGVARVKVAAKIAADMRKPAGITVVPEGGEAAFLAPLPVDRLPGVGPKTAGRLHAAGIRTIGDLAALSDEALGLAAGSGHAIELRDRARGVDPRPIVTEPAERVQVSRESTFDRNIRRFSDLDREIERLAAHVARRLADSDRAGPTVVVKLRYARDFRTITRSRTLPAATQDAATIAAIACELAREALRADPGHLRLVGVGVSGLAAQWQLALGFGGPDGPPRMAAPPGAGGESH
jgi:DNA polymerase IV